MAAIGRPHFRPQNIAPAIRNVCQCLVAVVGKIVRFVFQFFAFVGRLLFNLLCPRRAPAPLPPGQPFRPHPVRPPRVHIDDEEPIEPIPVQVLPGAAAGLADSEMPPAPDRAPHPQRAAALDDARQILRGGFGRQAVVSRLSTRDFITLYREFPGQRARIIDWSIAVAKARAIQIDPAHPYFEIFQTLLRNRAQYGGGGEPADYHDYEVAAHFSGNNGPEYHSHTNKFVYTIYSLIGFQELTRAENREWLRLIDNGEATFEQNPAYKYGRALSKIFVYPTRPQNFNWQDDGRRPMDIHDKIHHGINIPWNAYAAAKTMGEIPLFFQQSFGERGYNEHCFDARVSAFQKFMERYFAHPDFTPEIGLRHGIDHRALEHFKAFANRQVLKFAQDRNLNYRQFKGWVDQFGSDGIPQRNHLDPPLAEADRLAANLRIQEFFNQFKPEDFENYLAQTGQPLKTMISVYDAHERRRVDKPQGPVLQRAPRNENGADIEGWEQVLRRNGNWPDAWDLPAPAAPAPAALAPAIIPAVPPVVMPLVAP